MNYTDYIKKEHEEEYLKERDNLIDRILEAKYNMMFCETAVEKCEAFKKEDKTDGVGVLVIARRIYITVAWELVMQIKAYVDDNEKDVLTIEKFKNNVIKRYLQNEKRTEVIEKLSKLQWKTNKKQRDEYIKSVSDYRNKIVCHNFKESPELSMNIEWLGSIIDESIELMEYLCFGDKVFRDGLENMKCEMKEFLDLYFNRIYV